MKLSRFIHFWSIQRCRTENKCYSSLLVLHVEQAFETSQLTNFSHESKTDISSSFLMAFWMTVLTLWCQESHSHSAESMLWIVNFDFSPQLVVCGLSLFCRAGSLPAYHLLTGRPNWFSTEHWVANSDVCQGRPNKCAFDLQYFQFMGIFKDKPSLYVEKYLHLDFQSDFSKVLITRI